MSTRLIQIVTFANVANGATVALPHNINVNGTAKIPDYIAADTPGFAITANAAQVSVTNNSGALATVRVWLELKHTIPRELGALENLSPHPFVAASGSAGGGGGSDAVFAWDAGVSWATIYAAMNAVAGPKICLVEWDETTGGTRTMTNNGGSPTNLNEIWFVGLSGAGENTNLTISVDAGFLLASQLESGVQVARITSKDIAWRFNNTVAAAYTPPPNSGDFASINLSGGRLANLGTQPVVRGALALTVQDNASIDGWIDEVKDGNSFAIMSGRSVIGNGAFTDDGGGQSFSLGADATCLWAPGSFAGLNYSVDQRIYQLNVPGNDLLPVRYPDITDTPGTSVSVAVETTLQKAAIINGDNGKTSLDVRAGDPAWPTVFIHGTPTQADAVVRIADVAAGGSGFRIEATNNGGIQVLQTMPVAANEWGIWEMQLVAKLGRQLFMPSGGNSNLQQGVLGLQTTQFVHLRFAAGPGTLSVPGIAFPAETPGFSINAAFAHAEASIFISNYGGSADLILLHESGTVNPEYRFSLPGGVDYHIAPRTGRWFTAQAIQPLFDSLRWYLMSP